MNTLIFETPNFTLEIHPRPFVSRNEGGHIKIISKNPEIQDRTMFTPDVAIEFMWLSSLAGKALENVMNRQGIHVVKINYEELGNWAYKEGKFPTFHLHIFGRTSDAKIQVFPEAVQLPARETGFYDEFEPLTENDIELIKKEIVELSKQEKYKEELWKLDTKI
jgi:diadenosine tetraphosphate (Ap4A) HIT family hydrolase